MKLRESQLRRIIRESIKDLFVPDPEFKWGPSHGPDYFDADTMFNKNWDKNLELAREELLPQLSWGAQVLDAWRNHSKRSGDLQVYIPNFTSQDGLVMSDYGFREAASHEKHSAYRDVPGKLFVRTVSQASNYGSFMD